MEVAAELDGVALGNASLSSLSGNNYRIHSKSPLIASWPWNPSLLTGTHLLTVTVVFEEATEILLSRNGDRSPICTTYQSFSIHLLSTPSSDVSPATKAAVRKLETEPIQSTLLQLFLLFFFLYLFLLPAPAWSSHLRLFQRNRPLVLLFLLATAALVGGVFVGGKMEDGFVVAFQWGSFSRVGGKWEYAHWRDVSLWNMYECILCVVPLFLYSIIQVRKSSVPDKPWLHLLKWICLALPAAFAAVMWVLFLGNIPLNCVLFSINALWLPPFLLMETVKLSQKSHSCKNSIVFLLCWYSSLASFSFICNTRRP